MMHTNECILFLEFMWWVISSSLALGVSFKAFFLFLLFYFCASIVKSFLKFFNDMIYEVIANVGSAAVLVEMISIGCGGLLYLSLPSV